MRRNKVLSDTKKQPIPPLLRNERTCVVIGGPGRRARAARGQAANPMSCGVNSLKSLHFRG